ncbi:MAG: nitronate monooxygenase [Actinobacteria bacterium]|nr:nitronate monooxygenase [Actinomycetota bacterium]
MESKNSLPQIIQGGMGIAISSWQLARAVSQSGQLGVVSGTAIDAVFARRLQNGDESGDLRRALAAFPNQTIAKRVLDLYFQPEGRDPDEPYKSTPKITINPSTHALDLIVVANFAEVWLAKEGHDGLIGINYLEKIQMGTPSAAYGAMLAGVDFVLMGAGIPAEIPALLNDLAEHRPASLKVAVEGATNPYKTTFFPKTFSGLQLPNLERPKFLAIISAHVLAAYLAKDEITKPDGFIIEGFNAGGHNAPPRGAMILDDDGQPIFGPKDEPDIEKVAKIGLPFWLAGGYSTPQLLESAKALGAIGIQVGTLFSLAKETGLAPDLRQEVLVQLKEKTLAVRTDPFASPTGFPFKVVTINNTISESATYALRPRLCDLGYLRVPFERVPGALGYRCSAEPTHVYIRKGGEEKDALGRKCLCNGLMANIDLGNLRGDGYQELPLVTLGSDLAGVTELLKRFPNGWSALDVIDFLTQHSNNEAGSKVESWVNQ